MFNFSTLMADPNMLYASLLWGAVGGGFCLYGKKQGATIPLAGGLILVSLSILVSSALWMSLTSLALIAAMVCLIKQGY